MTGARLFADTSRAREWGLLSRLLLLLIAVALAHCGSGAERRQVTADSIAAALEDFLPRLGEAYASGDAAPLRGLAAPRELAAVEGRIADLAGRGTILDATLRGLSIERVTPVSPSNVSVATLERWDVRTLDAESREVTAEMLDQHSRVEYQLEREGARWLVVYRTILD